MYQNIMISVDELWLKGRNRPLYFKSIVKHIDQVIKKYHPEKFEHRNDSQRLNYYSIRPFDHEVVEALSLVPGISVISPVKIVLRSSEESKDLESAYKIISEDLKESVLDESFRVSVKRIDKRFTLTSMDVEREFGKKIATDFPNLHGDLKKPNRIIDIRILNDKITIGLKSYRGLGGLPIGTAGHGITMLSGGFDSPVASYLMSKRGVKQTFAFFYAYPFVGDEVLKKIKDLVTVLGKYQKHSLLFIVPFGEIQNLISKNCREEYRTIFFRKFMIDAANLLASKLDADCLITGDSLGQVSSQTLTNLNLIDKSSERIILRPLIGFNKQEVIKISHQIRTHDISVVPHDDACALFAPENPVTNSNSGYWQRFMDEYQFRGELENAINSAEVYSVNIAGELTRKENFSFNS